jgi:hypothetical protein
VVPPKLDKRRRVVLQHDGFLADIVAGYDFVGPRVEVEVGFGFIPFTANLAGTAARSNFSGDAHQLHVMGKVLYDFIPASTITPYIGAGAGIAFVDGNTFLANTVFAYEGIAAYNIDAAWARRREAGAAVGTTNANVVINGVNVAVNIPHRAMLYGVRSPHPPQPSSSARQTAALPSFMVFFDCDSSRLSEASLNVVRQAASAFVKQRCARKATGPRHVRTGSLQLALSLVAPMRSRMRCARGRAGPVDRGHGRVRTCWLTGDWRARAAEPPRPRFIQS